MFLHKFASSAFKLSFSAMRGLAEAKPPRAPISTAPIDPKDPRNQVFDARGLNPLKVTHPRDFLPRRGGKKLRKKFEDRPILLGKKNLFEIYEPVTVEETYKDGFTAEELADTNDMIKKALRMNNASTVEIHQYRIQQAIKKFQRFPNDTGNPTVQVAVMCERVLHMANHLARNRQDHVTKRALQQLLDRRRRLMGYLRRTNFHEYKWVTKEYGLPDAVPHNAHHASNFHLGYHKIAPAKSLR